MKVFLTMLLGFSALSVHATSAQRFNVAAADARICEVDDLVPTTMAHEGQTLQCQQFRTAKSSDKEHEFTWKEVTTTRGGELAEMLGDQKEEIDSLVINGPVNSADFETLFHSSLYGYLSAINLKGAELENNAVPAYAFYRDGEQHQGETFYYIHLRRIILPENVERIGNSAFYQALALRELNFPSSLRSVGDYAFYNTPIRMNPLVLPEGFEKIGANAFCHCGKLSEVILPSTIKQIGDEAFSTTKISSVNLPEGLESIGWRAFWDTSLKEVSIPNSCLNFGTDYVGENFAMNRYLEKIHLPEGMTEIPYGFVCNDIMLREINIPHTVKHIGKRALAQCTSLKRLEFPLGMQSLGEGALGYLDSLECIVFPASMKSLGTKSCVHWRDIKEIYCAATEPPVCDPTDGGVFSGFDFPDGLNTPVVYVPKGTINKYKDTSRNCMGWEKFWNYVEIDPSEFPTTAIDSPAIVETQSKDNSVYDLMGRKVERPQKGNIYIQNGKKFVAK